MGYPQILHDQAHPRSSEAAEFVEPIRWFRLINLLACSAVAPHAGLPPVGLLGELYGLGKKLIGRDVDRKSVGRPTWPAIARRARTDGHRNSKLEVAVADPGFWNSQRDVMRTLLGSRTTDRWQVTFVDGGFAPAPPPNPPA